MFKNNCGDCDNYNFDTHKCDLTGEKKETSQICGDFYNAKAMDSDYFGDYD